MRGFIHRVGDYEFTLTDDGNVVFTAPATPPHLVIVPPPGRALFTLPLIAFLAFAAAFVRQEEVQKLDHMTTDELIRMKFSRADLNRCAIRVREAMESLYRAQKAGPNVDPLSGEYFKDARARLEQALKTIETLEERTV